MIDENSQGITKMTNCVRASISTALLEIRLVLIGCIFRGNISEHRIGIETTVSYLSIPPRIFNLQNE
jgi:hypothetical protein